MSPDARRAVGVPVAVAVALPLAFARFSLLAAGLSLFVSALLLLTSAVLLRDLVANKRHTARRRRVTHLHITPTTSSARREAA
jgi:hypothetical protein